MDEPVNPFPNLNMGKKKPNWVKQNGGNKGIEQERGQGSDREYFYSICSKHIEPDPHCELCRTGSWEKQEE